MWWRRASRLRASLRRFVNWAVSSARASTSAPLPRCIQSISHHVRTGSISHARLPGAQDTNPNLMARNRPSYSRQRRLLARESRHREAFGLRKRHRPANGEQPGPAKIVLELEPAASPGCTAVTTINLNSIELALIAEL